VNLQLHLVRVASAKTTSDLYSVTLDAFADADLSYEEARVVKNAAKERERLSAPRPAMTSAQHSAFPRGRWS